MIINVFKNEIFPLVPSGYTSDDDKVLQPDTADDFDKMYIGNADDLDELILDKE